MYNILRLFCENLKAIEVKLTEIYTCKSPPCGEDCGRNDQLPDNLWNFKRVFLTLRFFEAGELCSSQSTEPILLKFCTLFLYINYEVTLSSFFFFNFNLFLNNKISDFFDEKSVFWLPSLVKNWKINKKKLDSVTWGNLSSNYINLVF